MKKAVPSDQASNLKLKLELELYGTKPKVGSQTFPPRSLNYMVPILRGGKYFLILFLLVPKYSTKLSHEWSPQGCSSRE